MDMIREINWINIINELNADKLLEKKETEKIVNELKEILIGDLTVDSRETFADVLNSKLLDILYQSRESKDLETVSESIEYLYTSLNLDDRNLFLLNLKFRTISCKYFSNQEVLESKILKLLNDTNDLYIPYNEKSFNIYKSIAIYAVRNKLKEVVKLAINIMNKINQGVSKNNDL